MNLTPMPDNKKENNMESPAIALEHIRFQLDLLRLTATPLKLGGVAAQALRPAEALNITENEGEAEKVMAELSVTAAQLADFRR